MPSSIPSSAPPAPVHPDAPYEDVRPNILAAAFSTWAIALVFVLLRFWTRGRIVRAVGAADWCIAAAVVRLADAPLSSGICSLTALQAFSTGFTVSILIG